MAQVGGRFVSPGVFAQEMEVEDDGKNHILYLGSQRSWLRSGTGKARISGLGPSQYLFQAF